MTVNEDSVEYTKYKKKHCFLAAVILFFYR